MKHPNYVIFLSETPQHRIDGDKKCTENKQGGTEGGGGVLEEKGDDISNERRRELSFIKV